MNGVIKELILILITSTIMTHHYTASANNLGLKNVFDNLHINTTKPSKYQDSAAGWYSGGSTVIRTKNTAIQPFAVTPPSIKTGCSGIDIYGGSFSIISGDELVQVAKNVKNEAKVYGFHLAMKSFVPQVEQVMKDLRNLAMQLNQFSLGHCKATQAVFAAALPKQTVMYEKLCEEMAEDGGFDIGGQRKQCRSHLAQKEAVGKAQNRDKQLLIDDYNLFTKAADEAGVPKDLQDALMSMVGTIVVKEGVMIPYPPLAKDEKSWNIHIKGGSGAAQYQCLDGKCLDIHLSQNVNINPNDSYAGKAKAKLDEIKVKIQKQTAELDNEEISFLDSLGESFPVFDHITLEAASDISIIDSSSEVIARYILLSHLKSTIAMIDKSITGLKQKQAMDDYLIEYQKSLDNLLDFANQKWLAVMKDSDRINNRAEKIEQHLIARERG